MSVSIHDVLEGLRGRALDERDKGDKFERLVRHDRFWPLIARAAGTAGSPEPAMLTTAERSRAERLRNVPLGEP